MRLFIDPPIGAATGGALGASFGRPTGVALVLVLAGRTFDEIGWSLGSGEVLGDATRGASEATAADLLAPDALTGGGREIEDGVAPFARRGAFTGAGIFVDTDGAMALGGRFVGGTIPLRGDVKARLAA